MSADAPHDRRAGPARLLAFRVGELRCAMDVSAVGEVLPCPAVRPLPGAPPFVVGACALRDGELPVLDLGRLIGRSPAGDVDGRVLLRARIASRDVGLLVDGADGVLELDAAAIAPVAGYLRALARDYLAAIADTGDGLLLVLDPQALLTEADAGALDALDARASP